MRADVLLILSGILAAAGARAQQPAGVDGSFHFTSAVTASDLREAGIIVRTVAKIPQVSDDSQATLTFQGTQDNVALAEWMLGELDRPAGAPASQEYKMVSGEAAHVNFLLPNVATPQGMQEILTVLRTVADIRYIFNYTSRLAIVLRGSEPDISFAQWIVDQLNQPPQTRDKDTREYTLTGNSRTGNAARVNFLTNINTARGMQELVTVIRTVAEIQKIFNFTNEWAMVMRGSDNDMARAEWLIQGLDQPAGQQNAGPHLFHAPDTDDVTRIFYISNATPQGLHAALTAIRSEAKIRRAFSTTTPSTVVVRGTADQVEAAAQIIAAGNGLASLR